MWKAALLSLAVLGDVACGKPLHTGHKGWFFSFLLRGSTAFPMGHDDHLKRNLLRGALKGRNALFGR